MGIVGLHVVDLRWCFHRARRGAEREVYVVRVRCTGASTSERTDGELRHGRKMTIQWCIKQGQPEPPDAEQEQPGLFDEDEPAAEYEPSGMDEFAGDEPEVDRPGFSDGAQ